MHDVLILGVRRAFSSTDPTINLPLRYGYIKDARGAVKVSNKIFERIMTDYFIINEEDEIEAFPTGGLIYEVTKNNTFNMQLCLERFQLFWQEMYSEKKRKYYEKECRILFLMYLRPLLNGIGFYHIESALTDDRRMDVVVTYGKELFILELKTWKGQLYNRQGVEQLLGYMNKKNIDKGYLLTFDFRKNPEEFEPVWTNHDEKKIFEVRV